MKDDEQTEPAPSMDDLIRGRRGDYQRAARARLFGPPPDTATDADTATDCDTVTADDGDDAA